MTRTSDAEYCANQVGSLGELVERIYMEHYASLCRFIVSAGCPPAIAPELVQETFVRLFEQLHTGKAVGYPRAWLIRVLHNLWLNHMRKHRREFAWEDAPPDVLHRAITGSSGTPEDELLCRQRVAIVTEAMRRLSATQARYLAMRAEGMKLREIADTCGVSISAVAEACGRGLDRLRLAAAQ